MRRRSRRFPFLTAALLLATLYGLAGAWRRASGVQGIDYYQFWVVGRSLAQGQRIDVYAPGDRRQLGRAFLEQARRGGAPAQRAAAEHRQVLDTYATPLLYAVARATTTADYEADLRRHQAVALAAFVLATLALGRMLGYSLRRILALLCVLLLLFDPLASDLRVGNVNSIQLAWLTGLLWLLRREGRAREVASGAILALAVLYKPNLAPAAGMLGLVRLLTGGLGSLRRTASGAAAAAALAWLASAAACGSADCWRRWLSAVRALPEALIVTDLGNFAPAQLGRELLGAPSWPVAGLAAAVAGGLAWWISRRGAAEPPEALTLAVMTGPPIGLLGARLAWEHYYVLAVPLLAHALRPARPAESARIVAARQILGGLALLLTSVYPVMRLAPTAPMALHAALAASGALLLLATACLTRTGAAGEVRRPGVSDGPDRAHIPRMTRPPSGWIACTALVVAAGSGLAAGGQRGDLVRRVHEQLAAAQAFLDAGAVEEAALGYARALEQAECISDVNLLIARAVDGLADTHRLAGRMAEAERLYLRSAASWTTLLGAGQPRLALTLEHLGTVCWSQGRSADAVRHLRRALEIREAAHGIDSEEARRTRELLRRTRGGERLVAPEPPLR